MVTSSRVTFQPTRPLRGATLRHPCKATPAAHFNPRAPCGARRCQASSPLSCGNFNPRAPCGARRSCRRSRSPGSYFNPRAPCGARQGVGVPAPLFIQFQPTRPLRGATFTMLISNRSTLHFNPRAPCGARQQKCTNHYAHFCDNRQISDAFAQNAACQGILLLFDAGKPCGFWVRTAQVISARLCFAL